MSDIRQFQKRHTIRGPLRPADIDDNFDAIATRLNELIDALNALTRSTASESVPPTYVPFEQNLGVARRSGSFDITGLGGLLADTLVLVVQTMAPIASKGDATDESEMDLIVATGIVIDATTIRVTWATSAGAVAVGTYAFAYLVTG